MNFSKRLLDDRRGTVAIMGGLTLVILLSAVGLVVTYSSAVHEKSAQQNALDSAVLAGAGQPADMSDEDRIAFAMSAFGANVRPSSKFSTSKTASFTNTTTTPSFAVADRIVTGRSTAAVKNHFAGIIGKETVDVAVEAAARIAASDPVCVLALDPVSPQGIEIYGTSQFTARNCAAQANSSDGVGMRQYGTAVGRARQFGVKGGYSGEGFIPKPVSGVPPIQDPYNTLPVPLAGPCVDIASKLMNTPAVLEPGTYCGGIIIKAGSQIIMQPGVYVMLDGGFRIDSNSTVTGRDVVIVFRGVDSTLYLGSGAIVDLTSPSSGPYMNVQFFQVPESSPDAWVTIMGDVRLTFDGVMYFPTQDVWIGGGSTITAKSPSYIFVAEKLWFQDNSIIEVWQENSRNLPIEPAKTIAVGAHLIK